MPLRGVHRRCRIALVGEEGTPRFSRDGSPPHASSARSVVRWGGCSLHSTPPGAARFASNANDGAVADVLGSRPSSSRAAFFYSHRLRLGRARLRPDATDSGRTDGSKVGKPKSARPSASGLSGPQLGVHFAPCAVSPVEFHSACRNSERIGGKRCSGHRHCRAATACSHRARWALVSWQVPSLHRCGRRCLRTAMSGHAVRVRLGSRKSRKRSVRRGLSKWRMARG